MSSIPQKGPRASEKKANEIYRHASKKARGYDNSSFRTLEQWNQVADQPSDTAQFSANMKEHFK